MAQSVGYARGRLARVAGELESLILGTTSSEEVLELDAVECPATISTRSGEPLRKCSLADASAGYCGQSPEAVCEDCMASASGISLKSPVLRMCQQTTVGRTQNVLHARRSRQRRDRGRLIRQIHVGVDAQRQANVRMAGQCLCHLRPDPGTLQTGDEDVPATVEVGKTPGMVLVGQEVGLLTPIAFPPLWLRRATFSGPQPDPCASSCGSCDRSRRARGRKWGTPDSWA